MGEVSEAEVTALPKRPGLELETAATALSVAALADATAATAAAIATARLCCTGRREEKDDKGEEEEEEEELLLLLLLLAVLGAATAGEFEMVVVGGEGARGRGILGAVVGRDDDGGDGDEEKDAGFVSAMREGERWRPRNWHNCKGRRPRRRGNKVLAV